ncbi:hypothetical protein F5884DRAFT_108755 [Xylogone sp. PMI_703]|nr:hypothetical protein F5884DRAFT_108755 [Xylogone sp. PMI_703]
MATSLKLRHQLPQLLQTGYRASAYNNTHLYRPSNIQHHSQISRFTQSTRLSHQRSSGSRGSSENNPSYPTISFADLGASRAVKITVYTVIGVLGTLETIFWTKTLWRYFTSASSDEDGGGQGDQ